MGDMKFDCPLCCNITFDSRQALVEHLDQVLGNLYCPICRNKWSSLAHLIEHLTLDNCSPDNTVHTVVFEESSQPHISENSLENSNCDDQNSENDNSNENFSESNLSSAQDFETATDINEESKMYVELLGRQLMKPCLQTQELKLVKENGESRYLIVTQTDTDLNVGTVVTKQNNDGTISLTTVKDMKIETDSLVASSDNEPEDNQEEIYSCNTCGVSFASVIDHIQNYHNDQEVVVEEPIEDDSIPMDYDSQENIDTPPPEKLISRRVITETGDIVEAPFVDKTRSVVEQNELVLTDEPKKEVVDKQGKLYIRRYVQVDKMCDSVVKNIKETDEKGGPYHKVVVKEVLTPSGSNVKMYHCMSCNIFVSTLAEFKTHPCKTMKYPCPHCSNAYENSKSLCAHMKVHKVKADEYNPVQSELPTTYECEVCNTVFLTNKSLKLHKRMHDPIKVRHIDPPVEGGENTDVRYMCNICHKMILIDYKTIHQNSHKTSDKMNCGICNRKFTSKEYLEMHMNVHNLDKVPINKQDKSLPYSCLYCNRRFARPHEKVKHERIHTGEKPHSCEICGKSFRVSYCLTLHMRTHTGARPYACQHCGKRFKAHSVYNHHLLTHSDVRAYKCPYCPKAFKTSVQLAGHKNSHTKPFSCQHCNRPFASLYAVRVHTETHARQNNLKFSCSLCGASYARAFALKDHVKQVHKQDIDSTEQSVKTPQASVKQDWVVKLGADTEGINSLNKDLTPEITQLEVNNGE